MKQRDDKQETEYKVQRFIDDNSMLNPGDTVVLGVSGGADSMCLLRILWELLNQKMYRLVVVHVNHGIRGEEALRDQKYVEDYCKTLDVPCIVFHGNMNELAKQWKMTSEEAGRKFRYECLAKVALDQKNGSVKVAVAHHMEDQAETMLFRMARGTGLLGLSGMAPIGKKKYGKESYELIRPLLCLHREEIEEYLQITGLKYMEDQTNLHDEYSRNYIRHRLIPDMKAVNLKAVDHMNELAVTAGQTMAFLQEYVEKLYHEHVVVKRDQGMYETVALVSVDWLRVQHPAVLQELVRQMIAYVNKELKDVNRRHFQLIFDLLEGGNHPSLDLVGNVVAFRSYESLAIAKKKQEIQTEKLEDSFRFQLLAKKGQGIFKKNTYTKSIDYDRIKISLQVRYRMPNDRIVLDAAGHSKSLNKYFIDEKVPRYLRDRIPLVCDGDQVIWIVGYRLSAAYYVSDETKQVLEMTYLNL